MSHRVTIGLALVLAHAAGCGLEPGESLEETGGEEAEGEETGISEDALIGGVVGTRTGLVARFNGCTAVFIPDTPSAGGPASHVLTNQHCVGSNNYAGYYAEALDGTRIYADKVYLHPESDWWLGEPYGRGKVDIALVRLSSTMNIDFDPITIASYNDPDGEALFQEGRKLNGDSSIWAYQYGMGVPSPSWDVRMWTDVSTEGGDSGSPVWDVEQPNISGVGLGWRLLGLHGSSNDQAAVTHAASFRPWLLDALNCGPFDTSEPSEGFCSSTCKCGVGEGDCDSDSQCQTGLVCTANQGAMVGLPSNYDICLEPTARQASGTSGYCGSIGGCQIYEGDCNTNADCKGDLVCRHNIGAAIGLDPAVDVCDLPRMPHQASFNGNRPSSPERSNDGDHCTVDAPCMLGSGDCDTSNHATCRGFLKCKANVGLDYGFTSSTVDVCVHPDAY